MKTESPFFSIVIPTYNRASLIGKTLESVAAQSFSSYEVIVVDDGSTDETEKVVQGFSNLCVRYFKKVNEERGAARNFGWQRAKGRFVTFLDSDDVIYKHHLETAYDYLQAQGGISVYAQGYHIVSSDAPPKVLRKHKPRPSPINDALLRGNFLSCFGVFIKTDLFAQLGFEENRLFAGSEDWLLWLRCAARYSFYYNNSVTGELVQHGGRSVMAFDEANLRFRAAHIHNKLATDESFAARFGHNAADRVYAHMLSYAALHLAMSRRKTSAIAFLRKSFVVAPAELLTRRTLAIFKKLLTA